MNWVQTQFESILADSKDGEWGEGEEAPGLRQCVVIRGTDFADLDNPSKEFPLRWIKTHIVDRKILQPGDIILEAAGGTSTQSTGRTTLLKESFFEQHSDLPILCASFSRHLRLKREFSSVFVYYLLQILYRSGYMAVYNIQHTGVSRFQYTSFKKHTKLLLPDLATQYKIAAILTAHDDLIETNKRRIALLEKIAEEIYREWFVRMRFPGYKGAVFHKGMPATWQTKRIREIVDRRKFGRVFRENELFNEGSVIVVGQSRADYLGFYNGKPEHEASQGKPILLFGDHSCKIVLMIKPFSLAENVIPFTPANDIPAHFLFHLIKDIAKTTEYKRHWADLVNRQVLLPDKCLRDRFSETIRENHTMRETLTQEIRVLTNTRDLLLPRLISGKLSVADLDIQFPPSMRDDINAQNQRE